MRLKGKTAIVTGSARGIGKGIALVFAREGANLVLNSRTADQEAVSGLLQEVRNLGGDAVYVPGDVGDENAIERIVGETRSRFGRIDILVNNAGIGGSKPVLETSLELWEKIIRIDLTSVFLFSKRVIREMIGQGGGKIVNISSCYANFGARGVAAYCAAKAGVSNLTRQMAVDYSDKNININAIIVGYIETEMTRKKWEDKTFREGMLSIVPTQRPGTPEDIGNAALFLSTDESKYICGHNLVVDGGWGIAQYY
jgi:NAD(P)-dependent dehydrogenase (short-subunit alcohol dehydrogenase family)